MSNFTLTLRSSNTHMDQSEKLLHGLLVIWHIKLGGYLMQNPGIYIYIYIYMYVRMYLLTYYLPAFTVTRKKKKNARNKR